MRFLWERMKLVVEPTGALATAGVLSRASEVRDRRVGIILSGGPASVYAEGAPPAPAGLLDAGVPVLGICYGFQLMVSGLGGTVERTGAAEYGATALETSSVTSVAAGSSTRSALTPSRPSTTTGARR